MHGSRNSQCDVRFGSLRFGGEVEAVLGVFLEGRRAEEALQSLPHARRGVDGRVDCVDWGWVGVGSAIFGVFGAVVGWELDEGAAAVAC